MASYSLKVASVNLEVLENPHFQSTQTNLACKQQELLAQSQLQKHKNQLIMFYSNNCSLCKSLQQFVVDLEKKEKEKLIISKICVDNEKEWVPEMLRYQIDYVPCFVACKAEGKSAIGKTSQPISKQTVIQGIRELLGALQ
eukprot:TRINITY_DN48448_c0_g1_i1.p2 TRINITY_DN48448_c0_g1~~TRINITY_DN48448_c0_g1_i1.p2  ORF type:complete len:141 (+),score=14.47 TRINITY_DN48448_c0_g1_i1:147-569(+)